MLNKLLCVALAATTFWSAPALAESGDDRLGKGEFFVFHDPSARLTTLHFDLFNERYKQCKIQSKGQMPSGFKTVLITALRNAPGAVIFGGLGAQLGGFTNSAVGVTNYGIYNGLATVGGSIGSGFTAHAMGKNATISGCMMGMLNIMHRKGLARDFFFTYNTFPVRGRAIRRSSLPQPTQQEVEALARFAQTVPPDSSEQPQDPDLLPPPPR